MNSQKKLNRVRARRKNRVRVKLSGTAERPRLSVFRSHNHIYVQLIDDKNGRVLGAVSSLTLKSKDKKMAKSEAVGLAIAKKALNFGLKSAVFDRGQYKYHGRIASVVEGARKGGLKI